MKYILYFLLIFSAVSFAQQREKPDMQTSGNRFLYLCEEPLESKPMNEMGGACLLFTAGLGDGIAMFADRGSLNEMFCSPEGATIGQRARILVKYIKDHPQDAHKETRLLMLAALVDAFPCPVAH